MDFFWRDDDDIEDGDEEDNNFSKTDAVRDGLILLIDASESMLKSEGDNESPFQLCLKAALTTLTNRIINKDKDLISIVFFGTEKEKNAEEFKNIYIFQDLNQPGAERILELENLSEKNTEDMKKEFGQNNQFSMSEVLWTCASIFSNCTMRLGYRKIMLFTNNDNPNSNNQQLQRQAKEKAKDLNDLGIVVELIHMKKDGGAKFDLGVFYRDILFLNEAESVKDLPDASEKLDHLLTRVRVKDHRKRTMGRMRLTLGEGLDLAVNIYNLNYTATRPRAVKLHKKDNAELKTIRKSFLADTGEILLPVDTKKFQIYASRRIHMENDEVEQIKSAGDPGLLLLGFKPVTSLKDHLHIRPSLFLYPDDSAVSGSTTLFSALMDSCVRKEQIAVCRFIPRRNTVAKVVVLLAQVEEKDDRGVQITPPGFHVIFQPFAEDIRKLKLDNRQDPPVELTEKAKEIVKKLQFVFNPECFEDPVIQTHWRSLEALALNRDEPEALVDYTMPDEKKMKTRAGHLMGEFHEMAFTEGGDTVSSAPKRKKAPPPAASTAKRVKSDSNSDDPDVKQAAEDGKLGSLTVSVLRQFCKSNNVKCGSKKADIIEAINDFLEL